MDPKVIKQLNRRRIDWGRVYMIGYTIFLIGVIAFGLWQWNRTTTTVEWRDPDTGLLLERVVYDD